MAVPGLPGDILIHGTTAIVSAATGTTTNGQPGLASLIDLTDPANARVVGTLAGVGSRLALSDSNILFSTDRTFLKGTQTELDGVQSAALGTVALIDGTDPRVVVVGQGPQAAETFKLKYRVIPPDYEIDSQKIQLRVDEATLAELQIPPLVNGKGETLFLAGYAFPKVGQHVARPRLVLNEGTERELISGPRAWNTEAPVVELVWKHRDLPADLAGVDEVEAVSADQPLVGVRLFSKEWLRRAVAAPPDKPELLRMVDFEPSSAPAEVRYRPTYAQDGVFETDLDTATVAGQERWVVARSGSVTYGSSDATLTLPGGAVEGQMTLTLDKPAIPADGASIVTLTLTAQDSFGNPVTDRTPVVWEKPAFGELVTADDLTVRGVATATYRSTSRLPRATVRASIGDQSATAVVEQVPVEVFINPAKPLLSRGDTSLDLVIRATSSVGPVDDRAALRAMATSGLLRITQPLRDGEARAVWSRESTSPTKSGIVINAGIAGWLVNRVVGWEPAMPDMRQPETAADFDPGTPIATIEPAVFAGDRTEDGTAPFAHPDGQVEQVPIKASARYRLENLIPGERIKVRLGSAENPNVFPVASYRAETGVTATVVFDDAGNHDGKASGRVETDVSGYRGLGFSFDGTGLITIPHDADFDFAGGFMVQTAVKPPPGSPGGVLIEKEGQYRLELVRAGSELRGRISVLALDGQYTVTSTDSATEGAWTLLTARYDAGQLSIRVGTSEERVPMGAVPATSREPIRIGSGFAGSLDEVRLFDLGRPPMALFANGQEEIAFAADASGVYETEIRSNGQLSSALDQRVQAEQIRAALADEGEPTSIVEPGRVYLGESVTYFQDRFYESRTWYGTASTGVLAAFFKLIKALMVGVGEDADIFSWVGEVIRTFILLPVAVFTDVIDAGSRVIESTADGWDAAILAMAVLQIAATVLGGRLKKLRELGALLKATSKEGEATKLVARLAAKEAAVELAGSLGRIRRAEKIAQVAFLGGIAAKHLVPLLRDIIVEDEDIDRLEAVVTRAEQVAPGERDEVLAELAKDDLDLIPVVNRTLLRVAATPVPVTVPEDEGDLALDTLGLAPVRGGGTYEPIRSAAAGVLNSAGGELMEVTPRLTRGIRKAVRDAFRRGATPEEQAKGMKAVFRVVKRLNRQEAGEAFRVYEELKKLGVLGVEQRYLSELTHPWWGKMHGALLQGRVMLGLAERAKAAKVPVSRMTLEVQRRLSQVHGTPFNRLDGEVDYASRVIGCESKNWGKKWTAFPPSGANRRLTQVYNAFKKQFLERVAEYGPNLTSDYYMEIGANFCGGGANRAKCLQQVQTEMARLLKDESGELRRLMNAVGVPEASLVAQRYRDTSRLADTIADVFKDPWVR